MASVETGNEPDLTGEREGPGARAARIAKEHWPALLIVAFMAGAFFLRLYYLSKHTEYTADSYYFLILARSIRDTFTYTVRGVAHTKYLPCLLYTSDAADDLLCVDLGGRRIIKKKKTNKTIIKHLKNI